MKLNFPRVGDVWAGTESYKITDINNEIMKINYLYSSYDAIRMSNEYFYYHLNKFSERLINRNITNG